MSSEILYRIMRMQMEAEQDSKHLYMVEMHPHDYTDLLADGRVMLTAIPHMLDHNRINIYGVECVADWSVTPDHMLGYMRDKV